MRWETIGELIKEGLGERFDNRTTVLRVGAAEEEIPDATRALIIKDPEDGIFRFWKAVYDGKLDPDGAIVVFCDLRSGAGLLDLRADYGGVLVGDTYIMMFDGNTKPSVRPSQRGIFLDDGRERTSTGGS